MPNSYACEYADHIGLFLWFLALVSPQTENSIYFYNKTNDVVSSDGK